MDQPTRQKALPPKELPSKKLPQKKLQWPQFEVIPVKNTLKKKALTAGNPKDAISRATQKADRAMEQLSHKFPLWMQKESKRLFAIRQEMSANGPSEDLLDRLFTCAHDIKGQATTYGYPVVAMVGKLLADLIEHAPEPCKIPLTVIDQHVDTIRAIVAQDLRGVGNAQTKNIIAGLHVLDRTTLKRLGLRLSAA
ncbi:MAG: hypothetical protein L3J67_12465 [Hyphomicrobiaceae bacterium]|nr:hypothetical protein [Hyphomicrobiaceae bacterium]